MRLSALLAVAAVAAAAHLVGHSVQGRRIVAYEVGDPAAARKVLVVGCLHGNECAGIAVVNRLRRLGPLEGVDLWLVPDANPDGHRARTRGNAHGVDLNRNFPHRWKRLRGLFYSGPRPASEPETRALMGLIRQVRPAVTIWFHQHLNMVVLTRGNPGLERRFARLAGLRAGYLPPYRGTATGWSNANFPGTTAFVVELPAGSLTAKATARVARAVRIVAAPAR
ncbi:MAG: M14 family zinc carboxypeptidase [Gaiellaceae bacterium]|jgi:protein MpaA